MTLVRDGLVTLGRVLLTPVLVFVDWVRGPARYDVEVRRGALPSWRTTDPECAGHAELAALQGDALIAYLEAIGPVHRAAIRRSLEAELRGADPALTRRLQADLRALAASEARPAPPPGPGPSDGAARTSAPDAPGCAPPDSR